MPRSRIRRPSSLTTGRKSPGRQEGGRHPSSTSAQAWEPSRSPESARQGSGTPRAGPAAGTTGTPSRTPWPGTDPATRRGSRRLPHHRPSTGRAWWGRRHRPSAPHRRTGRWTDSPPSHGRPMPLPPPRCFRPPSPAAAVVAPAAAATAFRFLCPAPPRTPSLPPPPPEPPPPGGLPCPGSGRPHPH